MFPITPDSSQISFQNPIRVIVEHNSIWHDLLIKTLLASQNQIYSEASSTHFSAINLSYFTLYSSKSSWFQIHHYISENYQTYRGLQFNLTFSITNQNTFRLSTQLNIFWSIFNTLFEILIYHTLRSTIKSHGSTKYPTFQKTIRVIAEHSLIWHFRLPIKTLLAYQRN